MRIVLLLVASLALYGQVTEIPGIPGGSGGGYISGASAVAAGQVLFGTAPGVAGSEANLTWDATNSALTSRRTTPGNWERFFATNTLAGQGALMRFTNSVANADVGIFGATNDGWLVFRHNSVIGASLSPNRNFIIGGPTPTDDGTNRLQVAGSIRAHDLNILDPTATLGATLVNIGWNGTDTSATNTQLIVRAGAGQGSTNLQTWQNSGGTQVAAVDTAGVLYGTNFVSGVGLSANSGNLTLASNVPIRYSSTTSFVGTPDASLSRQGNLVLQVGDGGSNSNGRVWATAFRAVGVTVANLPTASGNAGMIATVTDANATTIGTTVAGGGANTVLVWSNGTNWRIYAN